MGTLQGMNRIVALGTLLGALVGIRRYSMSPATAFIVPAADDHCGRIFQPDIYHLYLSPWTATRWDQT